MNKEQKIAAHKELIDQLVDKETDILKEIISEINDYYDEEVNVEDLLSTIVALMYISLKQSYKITLKQLNKIYNVKISIPKRITNKEIDKYTYSKDNFTLYERVKQYIEKAQAEEITELVLKFYMARILDNETLVVVHKLMKDKLKEQKIEYAMVVKGGGCDRDCCNIVEEWKPIDEIEEPPYHPNCTCEIIFSDPEEDDEEL